MMTLHSVEKYLRATGMSATRFGWEVSRDPRLVFDIRNGREVGSRLAAKIEAIINIRVPA
jgi:hypothetical protein